MSLTLFLSVVCTSKFICNRPSPEKPDSITGGSLHIYYLVGALVWLSRGSFVATCDGATCRLGNVRSPPKTI